MNLPPDSPVIQDILDALQDEELHDVTLEGSDSIPISANRFVLAARSSVLRRMLYGPFLEADSNRIHLAEYDSVILDAVVEYCCRNEISKFRLYIHRTAASSKRLVQLAKAADYLALTGLADLVVQMAHNLTTRYPPLACAVFEEADLNSKVAMDSLQMIRCRPYVTLPNDCETAGGISCITSRHKLEVIYKDLGVQAGELFLFQMLQEWYNESRQNQIDQQQRQRQQQQQRGIRVGETDKDEPNEHRNNQKYNNELLDTVQACASHLLLEHIEPRDLIDVVRPSGFCTEPSITDAITKQALKASSQQLWSLSSRGPQLERILVEGAGSKNVNGIYYRIDGLANGELYSKREISCGQQYVYSLSISLNKGNIGPQIKNGNNNNNNISCTSNDRSGVECRIFCSKLLTHNSIPRLASKNHSRIVGKDVVFQPIMQVVAIDDVYHTTSNNKSEKRCRVHLSDGEHTIYATLAPRIKTSNRTKNLAVNTVVKVLQFDRCLWSDGENYNQVYLHLKKLSVISQDPGHKFGNPVYYYDICDVDDDIDDNSTIDDEESSISSNEERRTTAVIVSGLVHHQQQHPPGINPIIIPRADFDTSRPDDTDSDSETQTLQQLYRLSYSISDNPLNSKIPASDLQVDTHGIGPGPTCRWIPATEEVVSTRKGTTSTKDDTSKSTSTTLKRNSSFNEFAASVLPLPLQSNYSQILPTSPLSSGDTSDDQSLTEV
eukprot:CAMPEP_0113523458 /NCGR_PEP_ID=MMETSP0014_2-20120614/45716_1 /TAXON_ID=2857 /ORGANISM="Nitzschia sp." /LENGTH=720 /DNA_ID=CAMNT_0000421549 /DNA_START=355 /DNA_END=2517 /DNA_ORIENTATION=+ /assembly_acc=CAM_ASM_000159